MGDWKIGGGQGFKALSNWAERNDLEILSDMADKGADKLGAERDQARIVHTPQGAKADIDYSKLPEGKQEVARAMGDELATEVAKLDQKIIEARKSGDKGAETQLQIERSQINDKLTDFKFECEHVDLTGLQAFGMYMATHFGGAAGAAMMDKFIDAEADFADVQAQYMIATGSSAIDPPLAANEEMGVASHVSKDANVHIDKLASGGKAEGAAAVENSADSEDAGADFDIEKLVDLASSDPEAFMAEMKGLSKDERMFAMQAMNLYIQEINQMNSMMSNIAKTQHDTSKAIINNMRV